MLLKGTEKQTCMGGGMWSGLNSSLFGGKGTPLVALERSRTSVGGCIADEDGGMPMVGLLDDFTLVI